MSALFTYRNWVITQRDIEYLTRLIADNPRKSRNALYIMVCRDWNWTQPNGVLKDGVCRGFMLKLHRDGLIKLPAMKKPFTDCMTNSLLRHSVLVSYMKYSGLYCTIALLIRAVMFRRIRRAGLHLSVKRVLSELDAIREVVNIYPRKHRQKTERKQAVLTKISEVQQRLMSILMLKKEKNGILG